LKEAGGDFYHTPIELIYLAYVENRWNLGNGSALLHAETDNDSSCAPDVAS
jgi:hypothetical protein